MSTIIKFSNRIKFELGVDIIWVLQRKLNKHICDIKYADMIISVFEPSGFEDIKSDFLKYFGDMSVCEVIDKPTKPHRKGRNAYDIMQRRVLDRQHDNFRGYEELT